MDWQVSKRCPCVLPFQLQQERIRRHYYPGYAVYSNKDNDPGQAVGMDINKGTWSHTIRLVISSSITKSSTALKTFLPTRTQFPPLESRSLTSALSSVRTCSRRKVLPVRQTAQIRRQQNPGLAHHPFRRRHEPHRGRRVCGLFAAPWRSPLRGTARRYQQRRRLRSVSEAILGNGRDISPKSPALGFLLAASRIGALGLPRRFLEGEAEFHTHLRPPLQPRHGYALTRIWHRFLARPPRGGQLHGQSF